MACGGCCEERTWYECSVRMLHLVFSGKLYRIFVFVFETESDLKEKQKEEEQDVDDQKDEDSEPCSVTLFRVIFLWLKI